MTIWEYQNSALDTAGYPNLGHNLHYVALGLAGEAGEVANEVKKIERDDDSKLTIQRRSKIIEELGDVLWYCAMMAQELQVNLDYVASANLIKLKERHAK